MANDIKLQTVTSSLTSLYNDLKDTVDQLVLDLAALTARVVTLENKMVDVTTKQPVSWNVPLENRLDSIEAVNNTQNIDITNLRNSGKGRLYVTNTCSRILVGGQAGRAMISCPGERVMTGLEQKGLATGSKQWSGYIKCCEVEIR